MIPPTSEETLVIQRVFAAPRERVYRAWTEVHALQKWFRPMGCTVTVTRLELHVGGEFQFDLTHPDGEASSITGRYIDISHPERLVFTWISGATRFDNTQVTVEFFERGEHTELRLTHSHLLDSDMFLAHQNGWACIEFLPDVL